jgi:ATP-binding cassette subfamily B protein
MFLKNLFSFLDLAPKVVSPPAPKKFPARITQGIKFTGVTFYYPGQTKPALEGLDLLVPAGKTVAIVGVNGAGKSTLFNLVCRFYDPLEGTIEIDGVDIREYDLKELRRNISVLFQFPARFMEPASVNIAYGDSNAEPDQKSIETAARLAGVHKAIARLQDGYNTLLGRWFINGSELSGGEWQKVALARAYFRQAQIIVLDEPTSVIDSWGVVDWFDRFTDLAANRTGLIITHRFTIAMRADVIHVMDHGKIIESGTHYQLVESNGFYAQSWESQMQIAKQNQFDPSEVIA